MYAYWEAQSDEDCNDVEAKVIRCVMSNGTINILFKGMDEGERFEGKISLKALNDIQTVPGFWVYPDSKKEVSRFTENQKVSEETVYKASVTGRLKNFRGKQVVFKGTWDDKVWDADDGCVYNFGIDANIVT